MLAAFDGAIISRQQKPKVAALSSDFQFSLHSLNCSQATSLRSISHLRMVIAQSIDQSNFFVQKASHPNMMDTAPPQLVDRNLCRVQIFTKPLSVNNHSHPQSRPGLSFFFPLIRHGGFCFDPTHCSLPFVERFSCTTHYYSLSFIPVSFLSIPPLQLPLTLTGVNERKAANRQTNKRERRRPLFFSSLLSSRPPALGENLVLVSEQKRRRNDTLPWHVCAAAVPCLAPAEEREKGTRGRRERRGTEE